MEGAAKGQDIGIVVLPAVYHSFYVITKRGPDAFYLVACHGGADPGPVDHNAPLAIPTGYLFCDFFREIRVIHAVLAVGPYIRDPVSKSLKKSLDLFFYIESSVIGTDRDSSNIVLTFSTIGSDVARSESIGSKPASLASDFSSK